MPQLSPLRPAKTPKINVTSAGDDAGNIKNIHYVMAGTSVNQNRKVTADKRVLAEIVSIAISVSPFIPCAMIKACSSAYSLLSKSSTASIPSR